MSEKIHNNLRDRLADVQHQIWSHWMKYLFSVCVVDNDGDIVIPKEKVERWTRQMKTSYISLSEKEQESDKHQADKVIAAIYNQDLLKAVEHLVKSVQNYESDTWSSSEAKVTREEAEQAAANLIYNHLFCDSGIHWVDGADVGFAVESLREELTEQQVNQKEEIKLMHEALLEGTN